MKKYRKILSVLLALVMAFSLMSFSASAIVEPEDDTWSSVTVGSTTVSVSNTNEGMSLSAASGTNTYNVSCSLGGGFYPYSFSLAFNARANVASVSVSNGGSFSWGYDHDYDTTPSATTRYGVVTLPAGSTSVVTITLAGSNTKVYLNCSAPNGGSSSGSGVEVYSYMPGAGQFANEGMGTGGWGDIYAANGNVKINTSTGVSLGYFGGSIVYDFGSAGISNSSTNPYGADFIVYGNAFWNNSEAACVQVAQAKLVNGKYVPDTWYDLAGSYYYTNNSTSGVSIEYTNPQTESAAASATAGTNVPITVTGFTAPDTNVIANNFHKHSFFPTVSNYLTTRTINSKTCAPIVHDDELTFMTYTQESGSTHAKLKFENSTVLNGVTGTTTVAGTFGYGDYYPIKTLGGTVAYNPYATGSIANASGFTTFLNTAGVGGTAASGGDPMDISWAVDSDGEPVNLTNIRYVRVYTGVAKMNGIFGEVSSEVCGIAKCTGTGSGAASTAPAVKVGAATVNTTNMGVADAGRVYFNSTNITVTSTAQNIYINGVRATSGTAVSVNTPTGTTYVQIITQNGTESPYVTILKITK